MAYTDAQRYWIWLSAVRGLGGQRFRELLERFASAKAVWEQPAEAAAFLGGKAGAALRQARTDENMESLFRAMEKTDMLAITQLDTEYPVLLGEIPDAPVTLYVRGRRALTEDRSVAIVGTRACTAYGDRTARRLGRELAEMRVTVVSGFARGIDTAAHRGAVEVGGRTVAVLGGGADVIYPPENLSLVDELLDRGGSIVSARPPGTAISRRAFPARNRVISGLSEGTVVVEASQRSGALMTAEEALLQRRALFAVPGQADSPQSEGTNRLLREGRAHLVTCAEDIARRLCWQCGAAASSPAPRAAQTLPLSLEEQKLYNLLAGGPADVDELPRLMDMTMAEVNPLLTTMEIQGIIVQSPGRRVARADFAAKISFQNQK